MCKLFIAILIMCLLILQSEKIYSNIKNMKTSANIIIGDLPSVSANKTLVGSMLTQLDSGEADLIGIGMTFEARRALRLTYLQPTHRTLYAQFSLTR